MFTKPTIFPWLRPLHTHHEVARYRVMLRRAWSLADELATLVRAVEAAQKLAETASEPSGARGGPTATLEALAGSLALVSARLSDLGRVVREELDPRFLWASHNIVTPEAMDDAGDMVFRAWGPKRRAAEARRALAQAEDEFVWRQR